MVDQAVYEAVSDLVDPIDICPRWVDAAVHSYQCRMSEIGVRVVWRIRDTSGY